jgi:glycosyltransferase involved in cell wall biosynthesis
LLWVVPRFGPEIVGGAEMLARGLLARALPDDWTADVATSCAVNHETWENVLPAGEFPEDGLLVRRFPVGSRDATRYDELHAAVLSGEVTYSDEVEWLANSVWSPELMEFLERKADSYDLVIFSPYLFGTTVWGAQVAPSLSALMPCLHDEPYARLETVKAVMESVRGCLFNSPAEETLARRLYSVRAGQFVGMGYDEPLGPPTVEFAQPRGLESFVVYAGRIEEGKRVQVAVEYAVRYAAERQNAPKLVLIGSGSYQVPEEADGVVVHAGFVTEEEKRAAYSEAVVLVNPSHMESLSLVLMEAWLEETPSLVADGSPVLREHRDRSGGGFVFDSYESYRDALDRLRDDPKLGAEMGEAGRRYVLEEYGWPVVRQRFRKALELLAK